MIIILVTAVVRVWIVTIVVYPYSEALLLSPLLLFRGFIESTHVFKGIFMSPVVDYQDF